MSGFHLHAVARLNDGYFRESPDEICHHAGMAWVQMGDEDKCNTGVRRHMGEKLFDGFQAAGGSADADDRESLIRQFPHGRPFSCGGDGGNDFVFIRFDRSLSISAFFLRGFFLLLCHLCLPC